MRTEDGHIINQCLNGNPAAFGFLVDKYKSSVYAFAYAELRNFHDADDVTQEVFITAYQKLRTLRRWDNFLAWLYSITSNRCKMWVRTQSRRPDREFVEDQNPGSLEESSIDPRRENPLIELLDEALHSLPKIYRQVLTLYYLGGMNSREIARFLGTSPATIRQRLARARSQLKEGILAMMTRTFERQRLQSSFTFRIVESIKRIKIHPVPRTAGLPWGLSLATGIIVATLTLSPHLRMLEPMSARMGVLLPCEAKVIKVGEIPVNMLVISDRLSISSNLDGDYNAAPLSPNLRNAFLMAAQDEGDTWMRKANMPTARTLLSASVVNGKIYAIGGKTPNPDPNDWGDVPTTAEYDPKTDTWTKKANMLTARRGLSTGVVNGRIYAIGGYTDQSGFTSAVEEYDPETDTWTKKADIPTGPVAGVGVGVVDGKLYAIGGNALGRANLTVYEYDPATDTWTRKADALTGREAPAAVVNGKIYVMGGRTREGQNAISLSTLEEYDPATDTWTKKADMPTARYFSAVGMVNGEILVIGGTNGERVVEEYDPATDKWTRKADMPTGRWGLAAGAVNGKIYAIGGNDALPTVEEYTPEGWQPPTQVSPQGSLPTKWGEVKHSAQINPPFNPNGNDSGYQGHPTHRED